MEIQSLAKVLAEEVEKYAYGCTIADFIRRSLHTNHGYSLGDSQLLTPLFTGVVMKILFKLDYT